MDALKDYIGFYDWEGAPCRIEADEDSNNGVRAEIYVAGKGYMPLRVFDVIEKAHIISEREFKAKVMHLMGREKSGKRS